MPTSRDLVPRWMLEKHILECVLKRLDHLSLMSLAATCQYLFQRISHLLQGLLAGMSRVTRVQSVQTHRLCIVKRSCVSLPDDIYRTIITFMEAKSLVRFHATCTRARDLVRQVFRHRVYSTLRQFHIGPKRFLDLLGETGAIIIGDVVAGLLLDVDLKHPRMVVLVPSITFTTFIHVVRQELRWSRVDKVATPNLRVDFFRKMDRFIEVHSVSGDSAIGNIGKFPSTLAMTFLSVYGLYSAYPELVLAKRNILNYSTSMLGEGFANGRTVMSFMDTKSSLLSWPDWDNHKCPGSFVCPNTVRTLYDGGGIFLRLWTQYDETPNEGYIYDDCSSVVWMLGGGACVNSPCVIRGFSDTIYLRVRD